MAPVVSSAGARPRRVSREEVQSAVAKAMELRSLHAALLQGSTSSPAAAAPRLPVRASPAVVRAGGYFTAEDYPVFTPSYQEEPLPGHYYLRSENQKLLENLTAIVPITEGQNGRESSFSHNKTLNKSSILSGGQHACSEEDQASNKSLCINYISMFPNTPGNDVRRSSRRSSSGDFRDTTTCNQCKSATISKENESDKKSLENANGALPSNDTQLSLPSNTKNRGPVFSWLFSKGKKKPKTEMSPNKIETEDISQLLKDWGAFSLESLKKELLEATENRDAALAQVSEMKSTMTELKQKLVNLETYCEDLKKALKQAMQAKQSQILDRPNLSKRSKSLSGSRDNSMPVSHEVMVEGFLQIVSEARLSVKQFCKTLINQIEETDTELVEKLNSLLHPHRIMSNMKHSKGVSYHLEALINQSLYQDFENCVFQKNGAPKMLDPREDRIENFSSFVALRNLSWNEVLGKGTKYYSEDFSKFCDQKMSGIVSVLEWSRPWPEQLLQCFFVAAKCIWLLHLLAFSFSPPVFILRVEENRHFDPQYMEDILHDKQRAQAPARVKIMVMPGFYVEDRVLRCRVLCRYPSLPQ